MSYPIRIYAHTSSRNIMHVCNYIITLPRPYYLIIIQPNRWAFHTDCAIFKRRRRALPTRERRYYNYYIIVHIVELYTARGTNERVKYISYKIICKYACNMHIYIYEHIRLTRVSHRV